MTSNEVKRRSYAGHLTTAINKLKAHLTEVSLNESKIEALIEQVSSKFLKLQTIVSTIQEGMDEKALEEDLEKMDKIENEVIEVKTKAKTVLKKLQQMPPVKPELTVPLTQPQPPTVAVKLPDVTLPEFLGDEESFPSFMDQFNALIDKNPNLTPVEKFGYLRGAVKVDIIKYFPLTAENYPAALKRLKEEYGDEDLIAKKHMHSLLDMSKRKSPTSNKELQDFYNFLKSKLACLEALNKPVQQNDEMLITLICRKLPFKLKNKVAQLDNTHSTVSSVMNIIKTHIITTKRMDLREEQDSESDDDIFGNTKKDQNS